MYLLVWLHASNPVRPRGGDNRTRVSAEAWWSPSLRRALLEDEALQDALEGGLLALESAKEWRETFRDHGQFVHGFALLRSAGIATPLHTLSEAEAEARDFWSVIRFRAEPLRAEPLLPWRS